MGGSVVKPSEEMLKSPAFLALGGSARSVLRILLEEFADADGQPVSLSTAFFEAGGVVANALRTGTRELVALGFISIRTSGTTSRTFSPSDRWRAIADRAEAERRLAEVKAAAAARQPARRRAAPAKAAADDAGGDHALPEGVRRSTWPAMPWSQGGAS